MVWTETEASREWARAYRRAKRRERRWYWGIGSGGTVVFALAFGLLTFPHRADVADAQDVLTPPSSTTTFVPPPPPVELVPETVPTTVAPGWLTVRVVVPGFDGLGKVVTDGQHTKARILPGDVGRAVIAVATDPTNAATVIVNGEPWAVFARGSIPADGLAAVTGPYPEEATVYLVSSVAGDTRPFVEARQP